VTLAKRYKRRTRSDDCSADGQTGRQRDRERESVCEDRKRHSETERK
jgi:hypothetical protein